MKWGKYLRKEMLWQWRAYYINYKRLKHIIRQLRQLKNPQTTDAAISEQFTKNFFSFIDTDMETVEKFYCEKETKLIEQANAVIEMFDPISHSDSPRQKRNAAANLSILRGLTNLLPLFQQLQKYAQLNKDGFGKIFKKWDKHFPKCKISTEDYLARLRKQTFFEAAKLNKFIEQIESKISWYQLALEGHGGGDVTNTYNKPNPSSSVSTTDASKLLDSFRINQKGSSGITSLSSVINYRGANGNTLLMYACATGAYDIAEILIQSGCDIHAVNAYGRNAVHVCAQAGYLDCLQLLLKKEVKYDEVDLDHCTPLHLAVKNERYDICVLLLEKDASLVDIPDCDGQNPLMLSCWKRNSKIMNVCLQYTSNINAVDWIGQNSLHYACKSNYSEGVSALLKRNINIFQANHHGLSPFHVAASNGHLKILQQLMDHADTNNSGVKTSEICRITDDKGWTMLHHACAHGEKAVVEYLLSIGADVSITDSFGYCSHCIAVLKGKTRLYSLLTPCNPTSNNIQIDSKTPDIEVKKTDNISTTCMVRFQLICDETEGQTIYIIGNCAALGNWDVNKGIPMKPVIGTTTAAALDKLIATETPTALLIKNQSGSGMRWVCDVDLPKNTTVKYRYILKISTKWEDISGDRTFTVTESSVVDDGVFEKTMGNHISPLPKVINDEDGKDSLSNGLRWHSNNWMDNDVRLYLRLGHRTQIKKQYAPVVMSEDIEIAKIVIKSGYTEANNFQGASLQIVLPLDDPLAEWKFQGRKEQISSLCTLQFDFYPKFGPPVARGYVLPEQMLHESAGAISIPLHAVGELSDRCAGKFYFEYLLARPFEHSKCGAILNRCFPKEPVLVGHRGTGSWRSVFRPGPRRTHIKENTILAFNTASAHGAQYVEFDVQLTRDKIPVIYHDFLFHSKGFTIPVNNVTLKQWKEFNKDLRKDRKKSNSKCGTDVNPPPKKPTNPTNQGRPLPVLRASSSLGNYKTKTKEVYENKCNDLGDPDNEKVNSLKHGLDGLNWVKDDYCTLEEAFHSVPSSVGFNVEVKYPNHEECVEDDVSFIDLNEYLDEILKVIFNCAGDRKIVFSSFHPDICTLLMAKQPQYPVFFLTTGDPYYTDPRTNSWFGALQFAKRNHMFGIVSSAVPCMVAPHLINAMHESSLLLMTYGDANNDLRSVSVQRQHGINGIIADHVQHVKLHIQTNPVQKKNPST